MKPIYVFEEMRMLTNKSWNSSGLKFIIEQNY